MDVLDFENLSTDAVRDWLTERSEELEAASEYGERGLLKFQNDLLVALNGFVFRDILHALHKAPKHQSEIISAFSELASFMDERLQRNSLDAVAFSALSSTFSLSGMEAFPSAVLAVQSTDAEETASILVASLNLTAARAILKVSASSNLDSNSNRDFDDGEVMVRDGGAEDSLKPLKSEELHSEVFKVANDYVMIRDRAKVGKGFAMVLLFFAFFDLIAKRVAEITTIVKGKT